MDSIAGDGDCGLTLKVSVFDFDLPNAFVAHLCIESMRQSGATGLPISAVDRTAII
jgi:hypothetical protein